MSLHFVFDFGRVLFDWQPARLVRLVLPEVVTDATPAEHWVREVFQGYGGDWFEYDCGRIDPGPLAERMAGRTGLTLQQSRRIIDSVPDHLTPLPESVDLLRRVCSVGVPVFYLSNMPGPVADELERRHEFIGCFADGVFSARVSLAKPDPAIFALAAQRFGVPAGDLVFLDDHAPNIEAAREAGWRGVVFSDARQAEAELRSLGWWPVA